ncbi:zincin-like metallopeptidase toxin 2 of polymorphic toxin system [Flavobacterium sp. 90]|uniref:hypothetical protein n=1 Tax=unclassified Flavobacterium TaxID=196869 RepID=UPI000EAD0ACA|nr:MULTISPECIES: hypothetical protein [unclassified Flavobacterium]RKR10055.1 zincin-like metallopeptidase toxin 2 of polymorphic toxin system [Flavobacterium sp. 81]TCK53840.1 zincin-like metallopeptidase toxin 2 of polymorphic toxin system [Flavobacterium sp. 90]
MKNILRINSKLFLLFVLLLGSITTKAQTGESGEDPFDFNGMNDLNNVDVYASAGDSNDNYASEFWYRDYDIPANSNPDYYNNGVTKSGGNSGGNSGEGSGNGANAPKVSVIVLTKPVAPGQEHSQAVKVLKDQNRPDVFISQILVKGMVIGTVTFSNPKKENGREIYTKMTVYAYATSPLTITSITSNPNGDKDYSNTSPGIKEYNIEQVVHADILFTDKTMTIEVHIPTSEDEDMVIRGNAIPIDTPQSYEEALNSVSDGDYRITNGVVKIRNDQGVYTLIAEVNVNSPTILQKVKKLAAIITKSLGGDEKETLINVEKGKDLSSETPAWARKINSVRNTIFLNSNGGFSSFLNNINNFKSIIKHEMFHVENNRLNIASNLSNHADVYVKAVNDYTFSVTTDEFKSGIAGSFANYLLNLAQNPKISLSEILTKIDSFNKNKAGVQILKPAGVITKATLTLRVQYKNTISDPISYEKIIE